MRRTVGVTVSAVVVFIGSAFTILCGGLLMLGLLATLHSRQARVAPLVLAWFIASFSGICRSPFSQQLDASRIFANSGPAIECYTSFVAHSSPGAA